LNRQSPLNLLHFNIYRSILIRAILALQVLNDTSNLYA
jgi:hypothetical protein